MAVTRRPARARYLLLVLVLAAVTLVTLDQRGGSGTLGSVRGHVQEGIKPLQSGIHDLLRPVGNFLTGAADYGSLRRENDRLRQLVAGMQQESIAAAAAQAQADQVLGQAHLPFVGAIPTVAAQVIDQDPSNFENTLTIDKGTASGLSVGQPVVATGGLVGSIGSVSPRTATVRLLTDPSFVVGVRLSGSIVASAEGAGRGQALQVTFDVPATAEGGTTGGSALTLAKGQSVVTSGLALEAFPPGIPVARVASSSDPPGAAEPDVTLTPLVQLSRVNFVQVELWSPQTPQG